MNQRVDKAALACNKPRRTPGHPEKSHVVKACYDGKEKIIRFGEQGASTAGKPKQGESEKMTKKRASFKARHAKNIAKGPSSAAYWANKVKWAEGGPVMMASGGGLGVGIDRILRRRYPEAEEFDPVAATLVEQRRAARRQPLPLPPTPPVVAPSLPAGEPTAEAGAPRVFPGETAQDARPYVPVNYNRDNPYVAEATRLAEKYNLPTGVFLSLIKQESGYNPTRVSPRGAYGLTQLMPDTAKELGVDPRDPFQNMEGGARYLRQMIDRFGSLPLALAAYNAGPGTVRRAGNVIPDIKETRNYVESVMRNAGITNYAEGGLAALDQKYADGGTVRAPKETTIKGQDHWLAYITDEEAELLKAHGGSGRMTEHGVRAYDDSNGNGPGGGDSDNSNSNSEAGAQDAAGGNAGQGAGPTGAGAGATGEAGPGPTSTDTGIGGFSGMSNEDPEGTPTAANMNTAVAAALDGRGVGIADTAGVSPTGFNAAPGIAEAIGAYSRGEISLAEAIGYGLQSGLAPPGVTPGISVDELGVQTPAISVDPLGLGLGLVGMAVGVPGLGALGGRLGSAVSQSLGISPSVISGNPNQDPATQADAGGEYSQYGQTQYNLPTQTNVVSSTAPLLDWNQIQREANAMNMSISDYLALKWRSPAAMARGGEVSLHRMFARYADGGQVTAYNEREVENIVNQLLEDQYV